MEIDDPKMQNLKVYSRKQIINWIESFSYPSTKFQQLNNGVFFSYLLKDIYPNQFIGKTKINDKPMGQFQSINNLNILKKILNKHKYQMNLNVQTVYASKNCFQLANWFRNFAERTNIIDLSEIHNTQSSNPKNSTIMNQVRNLRNSSAKKSDKSLSMTERRLSNNKLLPTERGYYNKKAGNTSAIIHKVQSSTFDNVKLPKSSKNLINDAKSVKSIQFNENLKKSQKKIQGEENDDQQVQIDPFELLQQRAILENIEQFQKILVKVKNLIQSSQVQKQNQDYESFKKAVLQCIYKRN